MTRDEFDEAHEVATIETHGETHTQHPVLAENAGHPEVVPNDKAAGTRSVLTGKERRTPGGDVTWVRASDLLSSGTGRMAGRGIDT
jgi:hypothetical protein